jgi:tetratricopeptide (TPR) repeat protein
MALYYERGGDDSKAGPLLDGAETAAKQAITLASNYAGGYSALSAVYARRGKWGEAMDAAKQGLARDADDPELLHNYGTLLRQLGYLKESWTVRERVNLLEPLIPLYNRHRGELLLTLGMTDAGLSELQRLDSVRNVNTPTVLFLWTALAEKGRFMEATDALLRGGPSPLTSGPFTQPLIDAAAQVMRAAANKSHPPAQLPAFYSELFFVYAYASKPERMLEWPETAMKQGDYRPMSFVWWPTPSSVRKTERFKTLVRNAGLVDYWKARGWPDLCKPAGANDFACE